MCGFVGEYLTDDAVRLDSERLTERADRLRHRGPDARGSWSNGHVGMQHVRLKLLDPEHGLQPMRSERGTVLSFNGEIYNNVELRAELTVRGCRFATRSDTEVLLAAYDHWGELAWERLNGMFAFALYDAVREKLFLVRDRLGIKPLFYRLTGQGVEFGSEPGAWEWARSESAVLEPESIIHFLRFAQPVFDGATLYRDRRTLEPGSQLIADRGGYTVTRWHRPEAECAIRPPESETSLRGYLRHFLHLAVGRQMIADAPVGVFLSGGIDSAILVGLLAQMRSEPPATYTIALEGDTEELLTARAIASHWRCRHREVIVTAEEFFQGMAELIAIRQLPLSYPNEVLIYLLAKRAAAEVKAVLTGEGADELFGGYTKILELLDRYARAKNAASQGDSLLLQSLHRQWPHLDTTSDAGYFASAYSWFTHDDLRALLADSWWAEWRPERETHAIQTMLDLFAAEPLFHRYIMLLEYLHLPNLLARLDGATMAASLEGRVPYTDSDLIRCVACLPPDWKYRTGHADKPLLRSVFSDLLPPVVRERPKRAFHISLERLFASSAGLKYLSEVRENRRLWGIVNRSRLQALTDGNGSDRNSLQTWLVLSLSLWLNRNIL
ncbi:MAG: asparagine synthase (glutamine-hydrolyzing) [bacterium]|nr:asparagine synthase (glutamine-hydrolyzing) [bacterium]